VAPLAARDAEAMLDEIRGRAVLGAVRRRPPRDRRAIVDLLVRVSELAADRPEIAELDLNPVFLLAAGAAVADARVVLA
jgi:acyl-CoA synthetase (NDP forming)